MQKMVLDWALKNKNVGLGFVLLICLAIWTSNVITKNIESYDKRESQYIQHEEQYHKIISDSQRVIQDNQKIMGDMQKTNEGFRVILDVRLTQVEKLIDSMIKR